MKDILRLSDLTIGYGKTTNRRVVMQGIEAALHPGRLTCLIGDNGVGKSTLLRTISAFQPKLGGEIMLGEREIDSFTRQELARLIGVVLTDGRRCRTSPCFRWLPWGAVRTRDSSDASATTTGA